jgi:hypothetical protein
MTSMHAIEAEGAGGQDQAGGFLERGIAGNTKPCCQTERTCSIRSTRDRRARLAGKQLEAGHQRVFAFAQGPAHVADDIAWPLPI